MADDNTPDEQRGDGVMDDDTEWTHEDEARYQTRRHAEILRTRRRRRQAASFAIVVLIVFGIGVGAAGIYQGWWQWPFDDDPAVTADPGTQDCPAPSVTAAPVEGVTVTILNGTDTRGLAAAVEAELAARGFTVTAIANAAAPVDEVAQVRYGPESALQARTVGAHLPGPSLIDDGRPGTDVELTIGAAFTSLNPPEVAAAALAPVPAESPSGCVTPAPSAPAETPAG